MDTSCERLTKEYRELIEEYASRIQAHFGERLKTICLFGSVARGEADSGSDIDVVVVVDGLPEDIGARLKETNYIHEELKMTDAYRSLRKAGRCGSISDIFFTPEEVERHPPNFA